MRGHKRASFQERQKRRQKIAKILIKTVLWFFCIVAVIVILALGSWIWFQGRTSLWDGKSQLTLTIESRHVLYYVRFNPLLREAKIFRFPKNALVELSWGFGSYQAQNIPDLAQQEGLPLGELLQKSMTHFLGSLTDGYVTGLESTTLLIDRAVWHALLHPLQTNLSFWDSVRLLFFLYMLRSNEVSYRDFDRTLIFREKQLVDGTVVFEADQAALDSFAIKEFANPSFLEETSTWEIVNNTTYDGLGEQMRHIVSNSGFSVIGVRQGTNFEKESVLLINEKLADTGNIETFAAYFGFKVDKTNMNTESADIILSLGEDYYQMCCTLGKN